MGPLGEGERAQRAVVKAAVAKAVKEPKKFSIFYSFFYIKRIFHLSIWSHGGSVLPLSLKAQTFELHTFRRKIRRIFRILSITWKMDINLITFQFALPLAIRAGLRHSPLEALLGEHPLEVFHQGLTVGAEVGNLAWTKKRTTLKFRILHLC